MTRKNLSDEHRTKISVGSKEAGARKVAGRLPQLEQILASMEASQTKITVSEVARRMGVVRNTLNNHKKYRELIDDAIKRQQTESSSPPTSKQATNLSHEIATLHTRLNKALEENQMLKQRNKALAAAAAQLPLKEGQIKRAEQKIANLESQLGEYREIHNIQLNIPSNEFNQGALLDVAETDIELNLPLVVEEALRKTFVNISKSLQKLILQTVNARGEEAVLASIKAFVQYREGTLLRNPGATLRAAVKDLWTPNVPDNGNGTAKQEFEKWYSEAIEQGFCEAILANHLPVIGGEIHVRIKNVLYPVSWKEARQQMRNQI